MSYEFNIIQKYPIFLCKELHGNNSENKILKAKFRIEAQSKITRLIAPFISEEDKNNKNYEVQFNDDFMKADITYMKNPKNQINEDKFYFCILFRTENMNKPVLYYQYKNSKKLHIQ